MTKPNFILIVTDDQTYESLSRMPAYSRRAKANGVLFANNFINTSQCQPSRASMASGQCAHNHGLIDNFSTYSSLSETSLLPYLLKHNATPYNTCFCGKYFNNWNASVHPVPAGWDDWHGANPSYYNAVFNDNGVVTTLGNAVTDYFNTVVANKALAFIATAVQPFFLQASFYAPHISTLAVAAEPHPNFKDCLPGSKVKKRNPDWNPSDVTGKPAYVQALPLLDGPAGAAVDQFWRYATESLFTINVIVDQIYDALIAAGKYTNTYIIITTDHGLLTGEARIVNEKIAPYDPSTHIPLIISGPGVAAGKTCYNMTQIVDIPATILDLSGTTPAHAMDGISLASYLTNPDAAPLRNYAFMEWLGFVSNTIDGSTYTPTNYHCVRSREKKYVLYSTAEEELYDLLKDPYETNNVAGDPAYAAVKTRLAALVATGATCTGSSCVL